VAKGVRFHRSPVTSELLKPGVERQPETAPATDGAITFAGTLHRAGTLLDAFLALMSGVAYDNEGIPMSEMFFLLSALGGESPPRILESGRGGGQSTQVLGHWFARSAVISVEENDRSPNARAAVDRLAHLANVDCRFGDSRRLLPELLQPGDVVLIDGPKEFRALKLAFQLLHTGRPRVVFIHDLHVDSPARRFLERRVPQAFFSDHPAFVERFSYLDKMHGAQPKAHWLKAGGRGYGPTLACIPGEAAGAAYGPLLRQLKVARALSHARDKLRSFLGQG
jgi:predicted O-methyltransferase YrrM